MTVTVNASALYIPHAVLCVENSLPGVGVGAGESANYLVFHLYWLLES